MSINHLHLTLSTGNCF